MAAFSRTDSEERLLIYTKHHSFEARIDESVNGPLLFSSLLCPQPVLRFFFRLLIGGICVALAAVGAAQGQIRPLPLPDTASSSFGVAVALSGVDHDSGEEAPRRALVGASGENICGENSGAAYIYEKTGRGAWKKTAHLAPSDCEANAFFGRSLALSGDRALVGASKAFFADERPNVAYVFERDAATGQWTETARLTVDPKRTEGAFAASVALDGPRALVTARGALPANASFTNAASRKASARQASAERMSSSSAARTAQARGGAAYVFERDPQTGRWRRTARLTPRGADPGRAFGGAVALDGRRLAVTASPYAADRTGAVYVFERRRGRSADRANARWEQAARLTGFDDFSIPVALDGDRLLVGESRAGDDRSGAATLYRRTAGGPWKRQERLRPRTPYRNGAFGTAVSLSGERALVTGYDEQLGLDFNIDRVVYVFQRLGDGPDARWRQQHILDVGDVSFGTAVDHGGDRALVGHVPERGPGAAYVIGLQ
jgi:hypothetical protein